MRRPFDSFIGVDLGGGKGKTTAVARLRLAAAGQLEVLEVGTQAPGDEPWYDEALVTYLGNHPSAVVAIDAPLTLTACTRCQEPVCPGLTACTDPTIVWFRTEGQRLISEHVRADKDRVVSVPRAGTRVASKNKPQTTPYTQRATELVLHRRHGILPRETLGQGMGPLTARAVHLERALRRHGFTLHTNLLEVYPKATIHQLWGADLARRYKGQANTWEARAKILTSLERELTFAPTSRLARESCLANDHCFDAVVCAYTAYLWARDGWRLPDSGPFGTDGWIYAPGV